MAQIDDNKQHSPSISNKHCPYDPRTRKLMYLCQPKAHPPMEAPSPIYSRQTLEFATIAKELCAYLETCDEAQPAAFVTIAHRLLPLLYYKATMLPRTEPLCDDPNEHFVTELQYAHIEQKLARMLGPHNDFMLLQQPNRAYTEEIRTASIAEHLADVYQELKNFEGRFRSGLDEAMNDALWEVKETFGEIWGERIAQLLPELHRLQHSGIDLSPNTISPNPDDVHDA